MSICLVETGRWLFVLYFLSGIEGEVLHFFVSVALSPSRAPMSNVHNWRLFIEDDTLRPSATPIATSSSFERDVGTRDDFGTLHVSVVRLFRAASACALDNTLQARALAGAEAERAFFFNANTEVHTKHGYFILRTIYRKLFPIVPREGAPGWISLGARDPSLFVAVEVVQHLAVNAILFE